IDKRYPLQIVVTQTRKQVVVDADFGNRGIWVRTRKHLISFDRANTPKVYASAGTSRQCVSVFNPMMMRPITASSPRASNRCHQVIGTRRIAAYPIST